MTNSPLSIEGVDTDNVGQPSNDGSPDSGLYAVPIKLNRAPTSREAQLLVHFWDHPSQFSMMHRPGIARVSGSSLVLGKTTIDEVKQYHAATVRLAVEATNTEETRAVGQDELKTAAAEKAAHAHQEHIERTAKDISF